MKSKQVALLASNPQSVAELVDLVTLSCGDAPHLSDLHRAKQSETNWRSSPVIIVNLDNLDAPLPEICAQIDQHCALNGAALLVVLPQYLLEGAFAIFSYPATEFLVDAGAAEQLLAFSAAYHDQPQFVAENSDESGIRELHDISYQVTQIAKRLAILSTGDNNHSGRSMQGAGATDGAFGAASSAVAGRAFDPSTPFRPQAPDGASGAMAKRTITSKDVRDMLAERQLRSQFFDAKLFADPAWDILLDLFAAQLEGDKVSVTSLCIAANVPPTTALRWIKQMTISGMLQNHSDGQDGRRKFVALTPASQKAMQQYFEALVTKYRQ